MEGCFQENQITYFVFFSIKYEWMPFFQRISLLLPNKNISSSQQHTKIYIHILTVLKWLTADSLLDSTLISSELFNLSPKPASRAHLNSTVSSPHTQGLHSLSSQPQRLKPTTLMRSKVKFIWLHKCSHAIIINKSLSLNRYLYLSFHRLFLIVENNMIVVWVFVGNSRNAIRITEIHQLPLQLLA